MSEKKWKGESQKFVEENQSGSSITQKHSWKIRSQILCLGTLERPRRVDSKIELK